MINGDKAHYDFIGTAIKSGTVAINCNRSNIHLLASWSLDSVVNYNSNHPIVGQIVQSGDRPEDGFKSHLGKLSISNRKIRACMNIKYVNMHLYVFVAVREGNNMFGAK